MANVNINVIVVSKILNDAVAGLESIGVLNPDGTFNTPTVQQDVEMATLAETIAERYGVKIPAKLDKLVKILPLALELVN